MTESLIGLLVCYLATFISGTVAFVWYHPFITAGLCLLTAFFNMSDADSLDHLRKVYLSAFYLRVCEVLREKCSIFMEFKSNRGNNFNYNMAHGPHTWKDVTANYQSPINVDDQAVTQLAIREMLNWTHYDDLPTSITLENTGHTLVLRAKFRGNAPTLSGADLLASYTFMELRFHWGWCNSEGSEHTINNKKYPLEMQVMHRAGGSTTRNYTSCYDLLMISYVFELSAHNPFMDPLVQNLKLVQKPGKAVSVPPFPLSYLIYPFRGGFFSYGGSLTEPPCYQGTEWFIFPESLAISDFQLRHFRQLLSKDGVTPITRNSRPVQKLGQRVVNFNYFCPFDNAQLARLRTADEPCERCERAVGQSIVEMNIGQLVETIDTTTVITTKSNTSVCMTKKRSDNDENMDTKVNFISCHSPFMNKSTQSSLSNGIVIINSSSANDVSNAINVFENSGEDDSISEKSDNSKRGQYNLEPPCQPTLLQHQQVDDLDNGYGDGVGVGI